MPRTSALAAPGPAFDQKPLPGSSAVLQELLAAAAFLAALAAGCATGSGGGAYVRGKPVQLMGYAADRSESILSVTRQTEDYCRAHGGSLRVLREETQYQGQLGEKTSLAARTVGKLASVFGGSQASQASQASAALSSSTDYKTTIEFVCQ